MARRIRWGLRRRLIAVVASGTTAVIALLVLAMNVVITQRLSDDADALLRQRAAASLSTLTAVDRRLRVPDAPDQAAVDTQTWVFSGARELEQPATTGDIEQAARSLVGQPRRSLTLEARAVRLYGVPVAVAGHRLGTLVVAVSLAPFRRSAKTILIVSSAFGALAAVLISLATWWVVGRALRPVARMAADAARWGERDLDRRFQVPVPDDELRSLARTFNGLLDRAAASLRSERRLTAEISHELRTPLARIVAEADLALSRERTSEQHRDALAAVRRHANELAVALEALLTGARGQRDAVGAEVTAVLSSAVDQIGPGAAERDLTVRAVRIDSELRVCADHQLVMRALAPLLDNACRLAHGSVVLSARPAGRDVVLAVADDGPGVRPADAERIFEAGVSVGSGGGSGLGLALARRLARTAGGEVTCVTSAEGGCFELRLPALSSGG